MGNSQLKTSICDRTKITSGCAKELSTQVDAHII
jgi:hypothetical protein